MTKANIKKPVISIEGFDDPEHYTRDIVLRNIVLPENSKVVLKKCDTITFENVLSVSKQKPVYEVISSVNVKY